MTKNPDNGFFVLYRHRSIFPGRLQPSIVDTGELNFCVRDGNRWNLTAISTGFEDVSSKLNKGLRCMNHDLYGQALDRLVLTSCTPHGASTSSLSTS